MINQPHEKPEWFAHTADSAIENRASVNPVKKNRVAPILAIIAIALSATAFGLSKSPSDAETTSASLVATNSNSQDQVLPLTVDPSSPQPTVKNPATIPNIPAPTVPNGARGGNDDGEENHKRPGHAGAHKSGYEDNEGDDD